MKTNLSTALAASLLFAGISGASAFAQEVGIKVTTTLHPDGTRTDLQKDFSQRTGEASDYDKNGKLARRTSYKLDERGAPKEGVAFSPKGVVIYKFSFQRDAAGRLTEEDDQAPNGKLIRRLVYRYGADGQVSGIDRFDGAGNPIKPDVESSTAGAKKSQKPDKPVK